MADNEPEKINIESDNIKKLISGPVEEISIINLVYSIIEDAYESRASDIHIDPTENSLEVRLRIDGVLHNVFSLPKKIQPEVITRLKILSELRTDEHQAAQDGRLKFTPTSKEIFDIRISIIPTHHGENAVLRLLVEQKEHQYMLDTIGFSDRDLQMVKNAASKPYGMILVTGPTGSGKTTTLYTILKMLNTDDVSIITIEDPIEYSLDRTIQIQVNSQTGLTFADGLRSILRQDPNIIMVGEIRDEETAKIAVNASLTGHLLLSTLHTNDAPTALPRLIDMDVEPFLIVSTVNVVIAQRLVRRICPYCVAPKEYPAEALTSLLPSMPAEVAPSADGKYVFNAGTGCKACSNSGYLGRISIHEVLDMTEGIREAVIARKGAQAIKEVALNDGMTTMLQDGLKKMAEGSTTIEEILRVIHE